MAGLQFVTFFPAVALSAVFLGTGPGLLTTLLCAVTAGYFYFPPYRAFPLEMQPQMLLPVLVFCIDGVVVSLAIGAMHHYSARYRKSIAELQERELRYRGAVETSKDGFLLVGRNNQVSSANEAYGRMSGYHPAELLALMLFIDMDNFDSHMYFTTPSIGATLFLDDREAVDAIFRRADNAMYRVKGAGRNALCFFDGDVLGPAPHPQ